MLEASEGAPSVHAVKQTHRLKSYQGIVTSLTIHLIIILGMALIAIPTSQVEGLRIWSIPNQGIESLDLEISASASSESLLSEDDAIPPALSFQVGGIGEQNFAVGSVLAKQTSDREGQSLVAQLASVASDSNKVKGSDFQRANFYGIPADGNQFVFVVDSSRSMLGQRWNSACYELTRSIRALGPHQKFFVICFDLDARPMFDLFPPKNEYSYASTKNCNRVSQWMKKLVNGRETRPANALQMALSMDPDAIFLLSDGEIRDQSIFMLQQLNRNPDGQPIVPIHTISLYSDEGLFTLMAIAAQNKGSFRRVD